MPEGVCWSGSGAWGCPGDYGRAWVHLGERGSWRDPVAKVYFVGTSGVLLCGDFRRGWSHHQDEFGDALGWEERGGRGA